MIENWTYLVEGIVIFALTCVFPLLAHRQPHDGTRQILGVIDGFGTVLAVGLVAYAFENHFVGLFAALFVLAVGSHFVAKYFHPEGWEGTYRFKVRDDEEDSDTTDPIKDLHHKRDAREPGAPAH